MHFDLWPLCSPLLGPLVCMIACGWIYLSLWKEWCIVCWVGIVRVQNLMTNANPNVQKYCIEKYPTTETNHDLTAPAPLSSPREAAAAGSTVLPSCAWLWLQYCDCGVVCACFCLPRRCDPDSGHSGPTTAIPSLWPILFSCRLTF